MHCTRENEKNSQSFTFWIYYNISLGHNGEVYFFFLIINNKIKTIPFYVIGSIIRSKHLEFSLPLMYRNDLKGLGWKDQYIVPLYFG